LLTNAARTTTCVIGISHDELLAVHEIHTSFPDAPEAADLLLGSLGSMPNEQPVFFCSGSPRGGFLAKRDGVLVTWSVSHSL
jgi:hypothetical protein